MDMKVKTGSGGAKHPGLATFGRANRPLEAALQAIAKDLPHGVAPGGRVTPMDELPVTLHRRSPTLQGDGCRAWLL
jgi:hypothetical protein